jgi:hypothetical protein
LKYSRDLLVGVKTHCLLLKSGWHDVEAEPREMDVKIASLRVAAVDDNLAGISGD